MVGLGPISKHQRGMSLLEAMISLLILLVGVMGLAAAFQNQIYQASAAKNQSSAAVIAQSVATEMLSVNSDEWNADTLEGMYTYDFKGERLAVGTADPYYTVDVVWEEEANWFHVDIGVVWTGWSSEEAKTGRENDNTPFAYILNLSIARGPS